MGGGGMFLDEWGKRKEYGQSTLSEIFPKKKEA